MGGHFLRQKEWLFPVVFMLLALFILIAYSNTLYSPFVLDDFHSFVEEPTVLGFNFSLAALKRLAETPFGIRRLLPLLTFAIDIKLWGGSLMSFHLTNIVIHLFSFIVLFRMVKELLWLKPCQIRFLPSDKLSWLALAIAASWALNPVQTNAVTYLVQRMAALAALFYITSFTLYLAARRNQRQGVRASKTAGLFLLAAISWGLALMSKENSASLPAVIIGTELLLINDSALKRFIKKHRLAITTIVLLLAAVFCDAVLPRLMNYSHRHFTLGQRLLTELRVVNFYIFILLLPLPHFLSLEHNIPVSTSLFQPLTTFSSLLLLIGLLYFAWRVRKSLPLVTFGICWFLGNLVIESTVIPLELIFEHRLYLPSAGFFLAVGIIIIKLFDRNYSVVTVHDYRTIVLSGVIICLSLLTMLTYFRNSTWHSSLSLYRDCVKKAPLSPRSHANLAKALSEDKQYTEAIKESEKAIALGRRNLEEFWAAANNLILGIAKTKGYSEAIHKAVELLKKAPKPGQAKENSYPTFLNNLARFYLHEKDYRKAYDTLLKNSRLNLNDIFLKDLKNCEKLLAATLTLALENKVVLDGELNFSANPELELNARMAEICYSTHRWNHALEYCRKVKKAGFISDKCDKIEKKISARRRANRLQEEKGSLKSNYLYHPCKSYENFCLACAYLLTKFELYNNRLMDYFLEVAKNADMTHYRDALLLNSWRLYEKKKFNAAIDEIDKAIILDQEYARLWINRGLYLMATGDRRQALRSFGRGLKLYPDYPHRRKIESIIDFVVSGKEG